MNPFLLVAFLVTPVQISPDGDPAVTLTWLDASEVAAWSAPDTVSHARALARSFMDKNLVAGELELLLDQGATQTASRVIFQRTVAGHPVRHDQVKVVLYADGTASVEAAPRQLDLSASGVAVSAEVAGDVALALYRVGQLREVESARLSWLETGLCWEVRIKVSGDGTWHEDVLVNANTGELIAVDDLRLFCAQGGSRADGAGQVFDPNPVQTSGDHSLKDNNDSNSSVPSSEYFNVTLRDLDGTGYLTGPWCSTSPTSGRINEPSLQFFYQRKADAFEEVMCYYHIDSFQRYLQAAGQSNANRRQQRVDVNGTTVDNSWYDLGSKIITYGSGGVDDAEDADIIIHEYGHALHHDVQGSIGGSNENGAMSEGYGDYFAASFYDDALVGEWDAVSYTSGNLHFLRRVDLDLHYPNDKNGQVHHDGQIWAAFLWDMRMGLGGPVADNIIVEAMGFQSYSSKMTHGGDFILQAENLLYGGNWRPYIEWALHKRGIKPLSSVDVVLMPSDSSPTPGQAVTITLSANSYGGKSYATLVSLIPGRRHLGGSWNVDIDLGLDLLRIPATIPGMIGTLNSSGSASFTVTLPPQVEIAVPVVFQSAVLSGPTTILAISKPCALRGGPY